MLGELYKINDNETGFSYVLKREANIILNEINKNKIKEGVNLEERVYLNYHTYGEALSVDFKRLWNTGMYKRGGMVALKNIK